MLLDNSHRIGWNIPTLSTLAFILKIEGVINQSELNTINLYIDINLHKPFKNGHHFPRGKQLPRIDWLNEQIQKVQQNEKT